MPITPKELIEVPAKTLDKLWIRALQIQAPELDGEVSAVAILLPYNDAGETGPEIRVSFDNVMAEIVGGNMKLAAAFQAILEAVQDKINPEVVEE
jgi:hypothetical protein